MNLSDLEKQLQEIQKIDISTLPPEQLQEIIDKLAVIADIGEEMLSNEVQKIEENDSEEMEDYSIDDYDKFEDSDYGKYFLDINEYNEENESYDENNP